MARVDRQGADRLSRHLEAAEAGRPQAFYKLGLLFAAGNGVEPDYVAAHKWFNLAAARGMAEAAAERAALAHEMSLDEIARAQREAREWLDARTVAA